MESQPQNTEFGSEGSGMTALFLRLLHSLMICFMQYTCPG